MYKCPFLIYLSLLEWGEELGIPGESPHTHIHEIYYNLIETYFVPTNCYQTTVLNDKEKARAVFEWGTYGITEC